MPELPNVSGKLLLKILLKNGWTEVRVNGSHHIIYREGLAPFSLPVHKNKDLKPGLVRGFLKSQNLTVEDLIELLQK